MSLIKRIRNGRFETIVQIACEARLFTPQDRTVVTPNADTPYCMF